jgi:hypothetical protein
MLYAGGWLHIAIRKKLFHIGFLDPIIVNKKTCRGNIGYDKAHMIGAVTTAVKAFLEEKKRTSF